MGIRDLLLSATKLPEEQVPVPELGPAVVITVRGMNGKQRDAFEASCFEGRGRKREFSLQNVRAKLVATCCYENGVRCFTDDDVEALGEVRADIVDRLFGVAQRLSGMKDEDVEELGKHLPTTPISSISSSAWPGNSEKPSANS